MNNKIMRIKETLVRCRNERKEGNGGNEGKLKVMVVMKERNVVSSRPVKERRSEVGIDRYERCG